MNANPTLKPKLKQRFKLEMTNRQLQALYRKDLSSFIQLSFRILEQNTTYYHAPYIDLIADRLMGTISSPKLQRLIINMPPRMMKSLCASVIFPAWVLGNHPDKQLMCMSYRDDLARDFSMKTQKLMQSPEYQTLFPNTILSASRQTQFDFRTTMGGGRYALSTGGQVTGFGADIIIIDDPIKPSDANYKRLENCNRWFDENVQQRLNHKNSGVIIVVMQRVHEMDLTGYLKEKENIGGSRYWSLVLPAIAEKDEGMTMLSGGVYRRKQGEPLNPARENLDTLREIKYNLGAYIFAGQYQQQPVPIGETIVKENWFMRYKLAPTTFNMVIQSWDTAMTANDASDYSVGMTIGMIKVQGKMTFYILDVTRKKMEFPQVLKTIKAFHQSKNYARRRNIIVEDAGHGKAVIQSLRQDGIAIQTYKPVSDKHTRLMSITPELESGFVYLPERASWVEDFILEITRFPNTKHDDQVDALSQGINWFKEKYREPARVIRKPRCVR